MLVYIQRVLKRYATSVKKVSPKSKLVGTATVRSLPSEVMHRELVRYPPSEVMYIELE